MRPPSVPIRSFTTAIALILVLVLSGCDTPAAPAAPSAPAGDTAVQPTSANLAGVWNDTATYREGPQNTVTAERKITFSSDGAWAMSITSETKPPTGESTFSYAQSRGTFSVSGDTLTTTTTSHRSSSTPFADDAGWSDDSENPIESQLTAVLHDGKLYANPRYPVYKVSGAHTTLLGTWIAVFSSTQDSWKKYVWEFQDASHAKYELYSSTSQDFEEPVATVSYEYTLPSATEVTFTLSQSFTQHYLKAGGYLVIGDEEALGAATKE